MKKSIRMKVVLDLAQRNEAQALEKLAEKRKYRDAQSGQLLSLQNYHQQYMEEMSPKVGGVSSVNQLQANLQFVNQIDQAIQQQERILQVAEKEFQIALEEWKALHQKRKGLADLIERYKNEEQVLADKLEQKQIEDMLTSRFRPDK